MVRIVACGERLKVEDSQTAPQGYNALRLEHLQNSTHTKGVRYGTSAGTD